MPVISSSFTLEHAQVDGSRWCREVHVVPGGEREFYYLAGPGTDCNAKMVARAAEVNANLIDEEVDGNLARDGAPVFSELTAAQFAARLRARFRAADKDEACRLAYWLIRRIAAGHITDAQCRNAFGLTVTQWNTVKTRLQARHDAWVAVLAATVE